MHKIKHNLTLTDRRKKRTRKKLFGLVTKPRVSVFRSNQHIFAQAIDDSSGKTLAFVSDLQLAKGNAKQTKTDKAKLVAVKLASVLKDKKIVAAIFDRGAYRYHGRVKAIAESLRENGIKI